MDKKNTITIEPEDSGSFVYWGDLYEYRDLLYLLVRRDYVSRYKQTVLGPLWYILQPLLMTIIFTVVFGNVAKVPTDKLPPLLFYLCGMLAWQYFSMTVRLTSRTFINNAYLFGKVYFPRLIVPLSVSISNLLVFLLNLIVFLIFWLYFKFFSHAAGMFSMSGKVIFIMPFLLLQTAALGLGVGLWLSALTTKFRDLLYFSDFLIQCWFFATPIVYPLSIISPEWRWLSLLNPMTPLVETYRNLLLGSGWVDIQTSLISFLVTLLILFSGVVVFRRVEGTFIDTI